MTSPNHGLLNSVKVNICGQIFIHSDMMPAYKCCPNRSEISSFGGMPINFILSAKSLLLILIVICMVFSGCYLFIRHCNFYIFLFSTKNISEVKHAHCQFTTEKIQYKQMNAKARAATTAN